MARGATKQITADELATVADEMSERVKDIVFCNAKRRVKDMLRTLPKNRILTSDDSIYVTYRIEFTTGDIQQILARRRRKHGQ